jgi:beta-phosphoglucomutase-like phosphatase (HAD superfamily)
MADNRAVQDFQPHFDAVLFDLDGTLVDSEVAAMDVLYDEGLSLGLELSREVAHQAFRGQPIARCAVVEDSLPGVRAGIAAGMQVFSLADVDATLMATGRVQRIAALAELHALLQP